MKKFLTLIFSLLSLGAVASTSPEKAFALSKEGKAVLIDVREDEEIKEGMIDGAKWFPLSKINSEKNWKNDFLTLTEGKKIFLYCRSGNRSGKVQTLLKNHGMESENLGGYITLKDQLPSIKP